MIRGAEKWRMRLSDVTQPGQMTLTEVVPKACYPEDPSRGNIPRQRGFVLEHQRSRAFTSGRRLRKGVDSGASSVIGRGSRSLRDGRG